MEYSNDKILKDYIKVCNTIESCTKAIHINACIRLILNFMNKHKAPYIQLSLQLQNKLDILKLRLSIN